LPFCRGGIGGNSFSPRFKIMPLPTSQRGQSPLGLDTLSRIC
jgi:hypothetical protein